MEGSGGGGEGAEGPDDDNVSFEDVYELCELIAKGPCSVVRRCINRQTGQQFAVKVIDIHRFTNRPGFSIIDIKREVNICLRLKHPHIVGLFETFSNDRLCYLVFDHMEGADLCYEIVRRASGGFVYSEAVASHYMRQILDAVRHCHAKQILHRAISPDAVQLANKENSSPVKLANFHSAVELEEMENNDDFLADEQKRCFQQVWISYEKERFGCTGSQQFAAPERRDNLPYSKPVDVWALGCLLYTLLTGRQPYYGISLEADLRSRHWLDISEDAKELVVRMLELNPAHRLTVEDALKHPWIKERGRAPKVHLVDTVQALMRFNAQRRLKDAVLMAVQSAQLVDPLGSALAFSPYGGGDTGAEGDEMNFSDNQLPSGVDEVMASLDQIDCLTDSENPAVILSHFDDTRLAGTLKLYDDIVRRQLLTFQQPFPGDSAQKALQISNALDYSTTSAAIELQSILNHHHFSALLRASDVIATQVYGDTSLARTLTPSPALLGGAGGPGGHLNGGSDPDAGMPLVADGGAGGGLEVMSDCSDPGGGQVTRVRLVQFQRNSDEPMGITLKVNSEGRCVVARIIHGGMIHRQGTLHVGDTIHEINNVSAVGQSAEILQRMLRDTKGSITLKIVPSYRNPPTQCEIFVRALFDYDPALDDLIPCSQAGIRFHIGDILQVISKDDHNWWQARHWNSGGCAGDDVSSRSSSGGGLGGSGAGLIPSPEMQEWRTACVAMDKSKHPQTVNCGLFGGRSKRKATAKDKYLAKHNALFDQLDLVTYEEVVRLPAFQRKTLVLLGAHGVGRRHIKNTLISTYPDRFAYPIPRKGARLRKDEEQGKHYHFVSSAQMMKDIATNEYLEYGTHEDAMYGTRLETIREIHRRHLLAILDIEPQALKVLRTADYAPYVVFIAAPTNVTFANDSSLERLARDSELLEKAYQHYFDVTIHNNDIDDTIRQLLHKLDEISALPQWVPVSWVY